jgi:hypothetical protein
MDTNNMGIIPRLNIKKVIYRVKLPFENMIIGIFINENIRVLKMNSKSLALKKDLREIIFVIKKQK